MKALSGAISRMARRKKTNRDSFIVECSKISKDSEGKIKMTICDGEQTCKATICADKAKKMELRFIVENLPKIDIDIRTFEKIEDLYEGLFS